jgi:hypothetical protein
VADLFKIGHTKNDAVEPRVKGLQKKGRPARVVFRKIETECHLEVEKHLQHTLGKWRAGSEREWFCITEQQALSAYDEGLRIAAHYEKQKHELESLCAVASTNGQEIEPSPDILDLYARLTKKKDEQRAIEDEIVLLENDLKIAIGMNDGIKGVATWRVVTSSRLDVTRLKEEKPEVYDLYACQQSTRTLRLK